MNSIEEFHIGVKLNLDKLDSNFYPSFQREEIDFFLNDARDRFVKQRYQGDLIRKKSFEETQKRIDDLSNLVEDNYDGLSTVSLVNGQSNVYQFVLPIKNPIKTGDYWFLLRTEVKTNSTKCGDKVSSTFQVKTNDLSIYKEDPFNKTSQDEVLIRNQNKKIYIYADDDFTVTNCYITYLKKDEDFNFTTKTITQLADHTHREIIDMAVNKMIENIESPRIQTHDQQLIKQE